MPLNAAQVRQSVPHRAATFALFAVILIPFCANDIYNPLLAPHPALFWICDAASSLLLPSLLVAIGFHFHLFTLSDIGLSTKIRSRHAPLILLALIILAVLIAVPIDTRLWNLANTLIPQPDHPTTFRYTQMLPPPGPTTGFLRLLAVFYLAASAALCEEIFFRGLLRHALGAGPLRTAAFILLSSTLFATIHWSGGPTILLYAFAWGILFTIPLLTTQNLWPAIALHFITDWHSFASG